MKSPNAPTYTNQVTPEYLRNLDNPVFSDEQLATFRDETLEIISEQRDFCAKHPPTGIFRLATEGSRTRNGGVIKKTDSIMSFKLDNGDEVRGAQTGDLVIYPDGSSAEITTGAGKEFYHAALVGSRLSNGDEIIDTLQHCAVIVTRKGVPREPDFLTVVEE